MLVYRYKIIHKHRCLEPIDEEPHMVNANLVDFLGHEQLMDPRRFIGQGNQTSQEVAVAQAALDQVVRLEHVTIEFLLGVYNAQSLPAESFVVFSVFLLYPIVVLVVD